MQLSKAKDEEEYQVLRERFVQGVGGEGAISYLEHINGSSWLDFMAPVKRYGRRANATWVVNKWAGCRWCSGRDGWVGYECWDFHLFRYTHTVQQR